MVLKENMRIGGIVRHMVLFICLLLGVGCSFLGATGEAVGVVGKAGWEVAKVVGTVAYTGTSMAGQTARQANQAMSRPAPKRSSRASSVSGERSVVPLYLEGKSYYVEARVEGKVTGRFLLDTGASALQISKSMARKLKISPKNSQAIPVTLAGGGVVVGRLVTLKEVKIGSMVARDVKAIVLDYEKDQSAEGLLGMSFLENFVFQIDTRRHKLILEKR